MFPFRVRYHESRIKKRAKSQESQKEPWERNQIKWRIKNLRSAESLAGEPGGGSGAPMDARGRDDFLKSLGD